MSCGDTQDGLCCRDVDTMEENGITPQGEKSREPRGEVGGTPLTFKG